jgi:hypothetical protein
LLKAQTAPALEILVPHTPLESPKLLSRPFLAIIAEFEQLA